MSPGREAINIIRENGCIPLKPAKAGKPQIDPQPGCVRPDSLENRIGPEFLLVYDATPVTPPPSGRINKNVRLLVPLKKDDVVLWAFGNTATAGVAACPDIGKAGASAS